MLRYSRGSKETGIGKGECTKVKGVDAPHNRLTVKREDRTERTYDPRRQQGVSVYREEMRNFPVGIESSSPRLSTTSNLQTEIWA